VQQCNKINNKVNQSLAAASGNQRRPTIDNQEHRWHCYKVLMGLRMLLLLLTTTMLQLRLPEMLLPCGNT
jgi:hypothetical protein